jgi:hypothetical protein
LGNKDTFPEIQNIGLPLLNDQPSSPWNLSKILERDGKKMLLIFDQFENLQNFTSTQINRFANELFDFAILKYRL